MLKKTLSLILACLMLATVFVGCNETPAASDTTPAVTDPAETTAPEPAEVAFDITADTIEQYNVVRPEDNKKETETAAAVRLRNAISSALGKAPGIKDDWVKRGEEIPATAKEIVVGSTNRPETAGALELIREKDFVILYENERVVITGGCADATSRAVDYFIENYIDTAAKKITVYENKNEIVKFDYLYGDLAIDGTPLRSYSVVYPEGCDQFTYYSAMNLVDCIKNYDGIELALVSDKTAETEYELLVGETNRDASKEAAKTALADDEYILCKTGSKVVMLGKYYMSGAAAGVLMNDYFVSTGANCDIDLKTLPTSVKAEKFAFKEAKNVILMIGDGMGRNHIEATLASGKLATFNGDLLPVMNYCVTRSYSVMTGKKDYTDSAAAGTALATGYKTVNGYLGIDYNKTTRQSVRELVYSKGGRSSILTTDKITGATPAAFLVHCKDRNATEEIQAQIDSVVKAGAVNYCKGSVGDGLLDCTRESLQLISENRSRFFTMIEEAYTDKGGHNNDMTVVTNAVVRLNECIAYATGFVMLHPDTVLLITADHETGGITKNAKGAYEFTTGNHTNTDVPVYAIGSGMADFLANKVENTDIAKLTAKIFGVDKFGG